MATLPRQCHIASPAQRPAYAALERPAAAAMCIQFSTATGPPNPSLHLAQLPEQSGSAARRHHQHRSHKGSAHRRHCVCAAAAAPHPTSNRTSTAAIAFGTRCCSEGSSRHRRSACGAAGNNVAPLVSTAAPGVAAERDFARSPLVFGHEFIAPMKVRAFEIDQYAVVNNAVYVQYLQHARHELLEAEGLEHVEGIAGYALSELHIKYRAPLRSGDRFLATVAVGRVTRVRATFCQRLIRLDPDNADRDEVALEAEAVVVVLDAVQRPVRAPQVWVDALKPYAQAA